MNEHDSADRELDALIRAASEATRRALGEHPDPGELLDYHLGGLPAEALDRVQEHLSLCRECAEVVLDLTAFSSEPAAEDRLSPEDLERGWRRLLKRTREERSAALARLSPPSGRWTRPLLAAALLAVALLAAWVVDLRHALRGARAPGADAVVAELAPAGAATERSAGEPARVTVPAGAPRLGLVLDLAAPRAFARYRMELLGANGRRLWQGSSAGPGEDGRFLLVIPLRNLPSGPLEARLYGAGLGPGTLLASYPFELARAAPPRR